MLLISNVQGASAEERTRLGVALAEIQLLAVDVDKRGQGLATRLLRSCEVALSLRGCQYLLVKMNRDQSVVDWYAARGFQVLDDGQPFALRFEGRVVVFKDEPDEFRVGVKALTRGGY
ncbi:GNAT family N-acetyltransferase [Streptomyces sp. NPDC017448]|uniref:GNAT family N-acetyltransferase n=1 Tax=Streptomyces sp. NPDC017448 TaxID=3364996 RepID=UPI0037B52E52